LDATVLKLPLKPLCFSAIVLFLSACQTAGTGALDLQGYPNINVVPVGALKPITPQEEYAMLAELNAATAAQPVISADERAIYQARQKRLAEIARTHVIDTTKIIEAR
jgi:hypothetical protein